MKKQERTRKKTILVTGIGGNVGQGILRNIRRIGYDVRLLGTNIESVSSGNHLCDRVFTVPWGYESGYAKRMEDICRRQQVDLVIPSTDFEAYALAKGRSGLPAVATSSARVNGICLDKWETATVFRSAGVRFAETYLPSRYDAQFTDVVVKPREGRGSRGVVFNPPRPEGFPDTYVIQKRYTGKELTTGFYIRKDGSFLGQITFERELYSGLTGKCSVYTVYDKTIEHIITSLVKKLPVRGSCNIQSIVTKQGEIVPFEVNSRISGTNSIRAHFGFDDVRYTVDEYLYGKCPQMGRVRKGAAVRVIMDVIYPDTDLKGIKNTKTEHFIF